jgi:hypothetical protein
MNDTATAGNLASTASSSDERVIPLTQFLADFGPGLLEAVGRQNPPTFEGVPDPRRDAVMDGLERAPFPAQREVVQAVTRLLVDAGERAAIINAEMGTGKTMMAICAAAVLHAEGYRRALVLSPPHLVYKWRREILETVLGARVWVRNGPDTICTLLRLRMLLDQACEDDGPQFFVMGRAVRGALAQCRPTPRRLPSGLASLWRNHHNSPCTRRS